MNTDCAFVYKLWLSKHLPWIKDVSFYFTCVVCRQYVMVIEKPLYNHADYIEVKNIPLYSHVDYIEIKNKDDIQNLRGIQWNCHKALEYSHINYHDVLLYLLSQ